MKNIKEKATVELYTNRLMIPLSLAIEIEGNNYSLREKNKIYKKALRLACQVIEHNDPVGNDFNKLMKDFMRMADNHGIH